MTDNNKKQIDELFNALSWNYDRLDSSGRSIVDKYRNPEIKPTRKLRLTHGYIHETDCQINFPNYLPEDQILASTVKCSIDNESRIDLYNQDDNLAFVVNGHLIVSIFNNPKRQAVNPDSGWRHGIPAECEDCKGPCQAPYCLKDGIGP